MALQLRIISDHRRLLGERGTLVLDRMGGSLGRSADNDWVLPDPQRYVSAHHARIHYRDGLYILEDISTNGVFVNDEARPVARRGTHVLRNGDVVRLGEYQVVAVLEPAAASDPGPAAGAAGTGGTAAAGTVGVAGAVAAAATAANPAAITLEVQAMPSQVEVLHSLAPAAATDIGASLDLGELIEVDGAAADQLLAVNAYGQPAATDIEQLSAVIGSDTDSETERQSIARRIARLARAATRAQERRAAAAGPPQPVDVHSGLTAFCRGAGIAPEQLPAEAHSRLLHLAGLLFREALLGLKDLERVRREAISRLHLAPPPQPQDSRPSLANSSIEEVAAQVLCQHESRRLDAVQWLREAIESATRHDRATLAATHTAFLQFIARLDPTELEPRFQRSAGRGKSKSSGGVDGGSAEARYWALFTEFYRSLTEMPQGQLPHTFLEAFANTYKEELERRDE